MKEGKQIFEEVRVGRLRLRNRLVRSATWLGLAAPDGTLPEEAFETYRELSAGGVGAVVAGFASVMDEDRWFGGMARLSRERLLDGLAACAARMWRIMEQARGARTSAVACERAWGVGDKTY